MGCKLDGLVWWIEVQRPHAIATYALSSDGTSGIRAHCKGYFVGRDATALQLMQVVSQCAGTIFIALELYWKLLSGQIKMNASLMFPLQRFTSTSDFIRSSEKDPLSIS